MIENFFKTAANLKMISRQGWIDKAQLTSGESVADHVYSTSIMAMVFGDMLKLDTEKLLKMSLLHDLSESITGDFTPEQISKSEKLILENKAMNQILVNLPDSIKENYFKIWQEYSNNHSIEAKLLHEIDKLEMALQATIYSNKFKDKSFDVFLNAANNVITNPELKKIFDSLKKDSVESE